jgi:hypothetical protein
MAGEYDAGGRALMTEILLLVGVVVTVVFAAVLLIEGALRPGYDPTFTLAASSS